MREMGSDTPVDVAIVGGGAVGLTLALALAQAFRGEATVALIAPRDAGLPADGRATAIAAASVALLEAR
jgi:2-polyprenyl-6-methoxyphenol hydroxylase-like FAD-dependent oxidoreductase